MKILLITKNYHGWFASGELDYQLELAKQADVTFLGSGYPNYTRGMDLPQFCKEHGGFDVVYYSLCATENPGIYNHVKDVSCPVVAYVHDGHNYMGALVERAHKWNTSLVLFRSFAPHYFEFAGRMNCPMKFHPQSINPELYRDYGLEKTHDVCFPGIVVPHYPLRCRMQGRLRKMKHSKEFDVAFTYHVGYGVDFRKGYEKLKPRGTVWREDYAKLMNQSRITMTTGGRWRVVVRRYFEAMACKSLLLAPRPFMHNRYEMLPHKHFVPVTGGNWEGKMRYYLKHYDQFRKNIVEPAYEWVMKYHTTVVRVKQLLKILETMIELDGKQWLNSIHHVEPFMTP